MVQEVTEVYGFKIIGVDSATSLMLKDHSKFCVSLPKGLLIDELALKTYGRTHIKDLRDSLVTNRSQECSHAFEERFLFNSSYLKCKYCGFEKN